MLKKGNETYIGAIHELFDADITIGNFSQIANGVTFIGGGEHPSVLNREAVANFPFRERWGSQHYPATGSKGKINIGHDVWIGENATILSGVVIYSGAVIGAGAVVTKPVPAYSLYVGNPARFVRYRYDGSIMLKLLEIEWWNWPKEKIERALSAGEFKDVHKFVEKYGKA
jgi:acetyltransferase-like isoleucine patch superfamily enzyme